ncbi:peptidoglycan-binding protein [Candidatus Giovannonibacteria bacterium]|nr:peptidoglycan-binding protein [Candidatus Giovannonibacteria bacterium]
MRKLFITTLLSLFLPFSALAINVTDTITLQLSSTGDNYTLDPVTKFDSLVVNSDDFRFTLSPGQGFKLRSSDKRKLTNDANVDYTCGTTESVLSYEAPSTVSSITVIVTPSGTCSGASGGSISGGGSSGSSSGGSSGGGGGGGGSTTVAVTPTPTPTPTSTSASGRPLLAESQIQAILSLLQSFGAEQSVIDNVNASLRGQATRGVSGTASVRGIITRSLARGSSGEEVRLLQEFLAKNSEIYPEAQITGYFGPLTRAAVKRFQTKHGIESLGLVGPKTRAKINEMLGNSTNP